MDSVPDERPGRQSTQNHGSRRQRHSNAFLSRPSHRLLNAVDPIFAQIITTYSPTMAHSDVVESPSAAWTARQLRGAFPFALPPSTCSVTAMAFAASSSSGVPRPWDWSDYAHLLLMRAGQHLGTEITRIPGRVIERKEDGVELKTVHQGEGGFHGVGREAQEPNLAGLAGGGKCLNSSARTEDRRHVLVGGHGVQLIEVEMVRAQLAERTLQLRVSTRSGPISCQQTYAST